MEIDRGRDGEIGYWVARRRAAAGSPPAPCGSRATGRCASSGSTMLEIVAHEDNAASQASRAPPASP